MNPQDLEDARREFPGTNYPHPKQDLGRYSQWRRKMMLWAYVYGPALLAEAERKEYDRVQRVREDQPTEP